MTLVRSKADIKELADPARRASAEGVAYDTDVFSWALRQVDLLRAGRTDLIDAEHIADEIADVAHYLADKLRSDLVRVVQHLLKWEYQPDRRSRSWMLSIREHRRRVNHHLDSAPGLRSTLFSVLGDAYESARNVALIETNLSEAAIPLACPYSWDEIMTRPIEWPDQP